MTELSSELADVRMTELLSWQSGIVLVRGMAARLPGDPPPEVAAWLDDHAQMVAAEIVRRSR